MAAEARESEDERLVTAEPQARRVKSKLLGTSAQRCGVVAAVVVGRRLAAVGLRDELQVRECHSMARSLRDQAHDESHERITEQLRVRRRAPKPRRLARTRGYNG